MTATALSPLPQGFVRTRDQLHQLAFFVLSPYRMQHERRMGLRAAPDGFGTPWSATGDGAQRVRMRLDGLVVETPSGERATRPRTIRAACEHLGLEYREQWFDDFHDPLEPMDPDAPLAIDRDGARALADWFALGSAVLESLRETPGAVDPSPVQLWPEHFDPATELGSREAEERASYGASPGDGDHDEPYLYVAPWYGADHDAYWNDPAFGGASIGHATLRAADDPVERGLAFLRRGHDLLAD